MTELSGLSIAGRLATPHDPDWDAARAAWNLAVDQQPSAVAFVEGPADVAKVVRFAGANGLRVAPQGTGHGAGPLGALDETILVKTERMRAIDVDGPRRTARVEAGVLALELAAAAQAHGLSFLSGSSPDVGMVGYTLGGGLGWLGRRHGFACNRVNAIEVVTVEGEVRRVDAENEPELFWALRGGGGGFAIVTALELDLLPIAEVYAGALILPAELGAEAVRVYRDWAATTPEETTSIVRFLRPPPLPDVPEPIRDRPLLTIDAAHIGSREEGERIIAPLRELGEPIMDTFAQVHAEQLCRIHMDPEHPVPGIGHHAVIRELPDQAIEAFCAAAGPDAGSPLLMAELRQAGGAFGRPAERGGALSQLDGDFVMFAVGIPMTPELGQAIERHLDLLHDGMQDWIGGYYLNFAERPGELDAILPADVCERLLEIKRRWDPDGTIRTGHAIGVPAA
jgi:hypothetical protein